MYPTRVLLENLFETVPQLSCLDIELIYNDSISIAFDFEFICEKFSCLRRLELDVRKQTLADNSVRIDRLEHLEELKIRNAKSISFIHRNNVRCLTIMFRVLRKRDLDEIPKKFPRLNRLTINCGYSVFASCFIRLHKLMPSCRIDYDSHRFYPQVYP
ncbi:uncharacterized protein LOC128276945 [Anopheles cruzii]|uniref:uncharacterized protein LOC128276945 n=1 Tax=Anopheles cruzii TaxID=68878 RepID=UPI0022EC6915|nr:uncharacterized protein LOC128276945 [Anopheles cruzii]